MRLSIRHIMAASLVMLALPASAQEVHAHGAARLDAALDGGRVELALTLPAMDVVGFERAARSDTERQAVETARRTLLDHARLWQFTAAAGCVAQPAVVQVDGAGGDADAHHHHDHDHGDGPAHHDWQARYRFDCSRPEQLQRIVTGLFTAFPSLQRVDVQWLGLGGATALSLTAAQPRIEIAQ